MDITCSDEELSIFKKIADAAHQIKIPVYLIGGFVRDKILGRPTKDADIVCLGDGIELAKRTAQNFNPVPQVNIFKNFGTAQIKIYTRASNQSVLSPPDMGWADEASDKQDHDKASNKSVPSPRERGWGEVPDKQDYNKPFNQSVPSSTERVWGEANETSNKSVPSSPEKGWGEVFFEIEFVGARTESYTYDSRKPLVKPGTLDEDRMRRDFTINTLAVSLNKNDFGKLIDPLNGKADIEKKIIKTPLPPDQTFIDDPLRMMRAIRFAAQLHFNITAETFEAIRKNAQRINIISAERITEELNKIILSRKAFSWV